jgi:hypothetical protein
MQQLLPGPIRILLSSKVMMIDPHPWSMTARGGNIMARITRIKLIIFSLFTTIKAIVE